LRHKIFFFLILIISLVIVTGAINQAFINGLKKDRYFDHLNPKSAAVNTLYHRLFVRSDRWRYGDLYGLSFLHDYKFELEPFKSYKKTDKQKKATNNILYIIGDSYLADKTLSGAFDIFDDVIFLDRRFPMDAIKLDSTKQNYLIMEFAERNLNDYDPDKTQEIRWTRTQLKNKVNFSGSVNPGSPSPALPTNIFDRINKVIFNKDISRNLELLLFDDKIFTPFKELKATLNYKLFNRTDKGVAVSTDRQRLLMNITVDTAYRQSSFRRITDKELQQLAGRLNAANEYYLSIGFKKVVLAGIPNAVSVYDSNRMTYNRLLERVEKNIRFPVISIFSQMISAPGNVYYRSDTHWNPAGLNLWIAEVNKCSKAW